MNSFEISRLIQRKSITEDFIWFLKSDITPRPDTGTKDFQIAITSLDKTRSKWTSLKLQTTFIESREHGYT